MECDIKYTKTEYDVYQLFVKQGVLRKWNERSECNVSLTQPKRNYNIYELHNCNVCNLAEMINNGITQYTLSYTRNMYTLAEMMNNEIWYL